MALVQELSKEPFTHVLIDGYYSQCPPSGVAQGGVLGPLLF